MFRELEKYVGTYRVKAHYDLDTEDFPKNNNGGIDESFEDLYIPCKKGEIRHTYKPGVLCLMIFEKIGTARNVDKEFNSKNIKHEYEEIGEDAIIYFNENDLKKVATIVKPATNGKSIKPFSSRNLPKNKALDDYQIPEIDTEKLNTLISSLDKTQKMLFMKRCLKDFDSVIQKKKGKNYDINKEREESGLKPKLFIHQIGLWEDFLTFIKKELKKV